MLIATAALVGFALGAMLIHLRYQHMLKHFVLPKLFKLQEQSHDLQTRLAQLKMTQILEQQALEKTEQASHNSLN